MKNNELTPSQQAAFDAAREPAFPCQADTHGKSYKGLTKRQYIATEIVKGLISSEGIANEDAVNDAIYASFAIADAILKYDK